jgi:hypothetical protein
MTIGKWGLLALVAVLVLTLGTSSLYAFNSITRGMRPEPPEWIALLPYLLLVKTALSSVNSILLLLILAIYVGIYRKTRSEFSLGLIIFSVALLLYAVTSNPLLHGVVGFRLTGLGPFTMLPDLFTCIASAILLYLSRQ